MANQLKSNPWLIDTPQATALYTHPMHNCQYEYVGYNSPTDIAEIQDQNGNLVARLRGAADLQLVRSGKVGWVEGLLVPVNTSDGSTNVPSGRIVAYFE